MGQRRRQSGAGASSGTVVTDLAPLCAVTSRRWLQIARPGVVPAFWNAETVMRSGQNGPIAQAPGKARSAPAKNFAAILAAASPEQVHTRGQPARRLKSPRSWSLSLGLPVLPELEATRTEIHQRRIPKQSVHSYTGTDDPAQQPKESVARSPQLSALRIRGVQRLRPQTVWCISR